MHGKIQSVSQNRRKRLPPLFPTLAPHTFSLTFATNGGKEKLFLGQERERGGKGQVRQSVKQSSALFWASTGCFYSFVPFLHSSFTVCDCWQRAHTHTHTGLASKQENESEARKSTRFGCFELFLLMPCTTLVGKNKNRERRMRILCSLELSLSLPHKHRFLIIRWLITSSSPVCLTDYLFWNCSLFSFCCCCC